MFHTLSLSGLEFLKHYEGLGPNTYDGKHYPYLDGANVLTIGYGHVITAAEARRFLSNLSIAETTALLLANQPIYAQTIGLSNAEADELLRADCDKYVATVNQALNIAVQDHMFDALVSLVYNCGPEPLSARSTLGRLLAEGMFIEAGLQFPHWNKATNAKTGKFGPWAGLTFRRYSELWRYLSGESEFVHKFTDADALILKVKQFCSEKSVVCDLPYSDGLPEQMVN